MKWLIYLLTCATCAAGIASRWMPVIAAAGGTPYPSGLIFRIDASEPDTLFLDYGGITSAVNGGLVGKWDDNVASYDAVSVVNRRPTLTNEFGKSVVSFTNHKMYLPDTDAGARPSAFTIIAVLRRTGASQANRSQILGCNNNAFAAGVQFGIINNGSTAIEWPGVAVRFSDATSRSINYGSTIPTNGMYIQSARLENTNMWLWVNNDVRHTNVSSAGVLYAAGDDGDWYIGEAYVTGLTTLRANIGEIMLFDRALTDDELTGLRNYLYTKWSIE